ncbi:tetratricopeptide repeat protein [Myroides sp. LJL119]
MKHFIISLLVGLSSIVGFANDTNQLQIDFEKANELYTKEHYDKAVTAYLDLIQKVDNSSQLYFNLANSYYKIKDNVNAVYYYEKALALAPEDKHIQTNLDYARANLQDDIVVVTKYTNQDIIHQSLKGLTIDQWAYLITAFTISLCVCFAIYYFSKKTLIKRLSFSFILLCVLGIGGSSYAAIFESNYSSEQPKAIVFNKEVDLKQHPRSNSETLLQIHKGTKVYILEQKSLWVLVRLDNQEQGWILKSSIKEI